MGINDAQKLLDESILVGDKRYATYKGIAYVAQVTESESDVWHGYPEAWDNVPIAIKRRWLSENKMSKRDLKRWRTRKDVEGAWKEDRNDYQ